MKTSTESSALRGILERAARSRGCSLKPLAWPVGRPAREVRS